MLPIIDDFVNENSSTRTRLVRMTKAWEDKVSGRIQVINPLILVRVSTLALMVATILPENATLNIGKDLAARCGVVGVPVAPAIDSVGIFSLARCNGHPFRLQRLDPSQLLAGLPQKGCE